MDGDGDIYKGDEETMGKGGEASLVSDAFSGTVVDDDADFMGLLVQAESKECFKEFVLR